ncbi:hypothetical protein VHEMI10616 [[Torrubiella] hemipterigena]|uniref:BZIP domain-containing protein n=1 Tax=[Torrubiella] hemipterigena TaxID=1531966 RepID=A0A0A1TDL1_9HYPO|nr:hypothetical protein VHEMI10616 [[Torrubiella] hemipterigena]
MPFLSRRRSRSPDSQAIARHALNRRTEMYAATDSTAQAAKEKAQARRAQVRKAQIEHRQRKANYVKQLELDISQLREMVTQIQRDSDTLKAENDLIRNALIRNGSSTPGLTTAGSTSQVAESGALTPSAQSDLSSYTPNFHPYALESLSSEYDMTVTLSSNKTMGTPIFSISPYSVGAASPSTSSEGWLAGRIQLTPSQELQAINFILALEHCCWDHFWPGDCHHHNEQTEEEKGHTLMASSYFMASAPESVYKDRKAFTSRFRTNPTLQWQASPVSLESLHGLAQSLNPGTDEIAPVQAWFELAVRYPIERLFDQALLENLKREFRGVVRCVVFGAAIERSAFESIIARVMGPSVGGAVVFEVDDGGNPIQQ